MGTKMRQFWLSLAAIACSAMFLFVSFVVIFTGTFPWYGRILIGIIFMPIFALTALGLFAELDSSRRIGWLKKFRKPIDPDGK